MKNYFLYSSLFLLLSCNDRRAEPEKSESSILEIRESNSTPTAIIEKYNLIINSAEKRQEDATEILCIKRAWPLIMQAPSVKGFDSILSKDFTFIDHDKILNRADYIKDRTKSSEWKITFVKYDNLNLQFFGDTALLTYRNHVRNENANSKAVETEHIQWADVYSKENDKWKIRSAHVIDITIEEGK